MTLLKTLTDNIDAFTDKYDLKIEPVSVETKVEPTHTFNVKCVKLLTKQKQSHLATVYPDGTFWTRPDLYTKYNHDVLTFIQTATNIVQEGASLA